MTDYKLTDDEIREYENQIWQILHENLPSCVTPTDITALCIKLRNAGFGKPLNAKTAREVLREVGEWAGQPCPHHEDIPPDRGITVIPKCHCDKCWQALLNGSTGEKQNG